MSTSAFASIPAMPCPTTNPNPTPTRNLNPTPARTSFLFDPSTDIYHKDVHEDELTTYLPDVHITQLRARNPATSHLYTDTRTLVVWLSSAFRPSETPHAKGQGAWAVSFGPQSKFNHSELVPDHLPQSAATAELYALGQAFVRAQTIARNMPGLFAVRAVTDSEWLARSMEFCWDAASQTKLGPLLDGPMEDLRKLYERMLGANNPGPTLDYKVWLMGPDRNRDAGMMANSAFPVPGLDPKQAEFYDSMINFEIPAFHGTGSGGVADNTSGVVGATGGVGTAGGMSGLLNPTGGVADATGEPANGMGGLFDGMGGAAGEAGGVLGGNGGAASGGTGGDVDVSGNPGVNEGPSQ